jgi:hypothetical protein
MARTDRAHDWRAAAVAGGAIAGVVAAATVAAILVLRWLGPAEPATVAVALGQDWAQVRAASTYRLPFPLTERTHDGYAIQDERVLFVYSDPTRGFVLPTARTVWFRLRNDRVEFIFVLPYREVMRWEEAADLAEETRARVDAAGWRRDHGRPLDDVKAYYDDPSHENWPAGQVVQLWREGDAFVELSFYRGRKQGERLDALTDRRAEADQFSVSVEIARSSPP